MEKQELFVQDKIKAIHKTKTTASIIKHAIIHINMYLEKGMNVVFHHHPNAFSFISFSFCAFLLRIACIPFLLFRELVSIEVYKFVAVELLPDKTVYVTDTGSYFPSCNSLTQARKLVLLMYYKNGMFISSFSSSHRKLTAFFLPIL